MILVSIFEILFALTRFNTFLKVTFIVVTVIQFQFTKPVSLILLPLTPIFDLIFVNLLPFSEFIAVNPIALVYGKLGFFCVLVQYFDFTITVSFTFSEFTLICEFPRHELIALTRFFPFSCQMHLPLSEVESTIKVPQNVVALTVTKIDTIFIFLYNHLHLNVGGDGDTENLEC